MQQTEVWSAQVQALLRREIVTVGDKAVSKALAKHIVANYPTLPLPMGGVDWMQVEDAIQLPVDTLTDMNASMFLLSTRLSSCSNVAVVHGPRHACLVVSLQNTLRHLDVLAAPRVTYFAGLLATATGYALAPDHFVECKFDQRVWLSGLPR